MARPKSANGGHPDHLRPQVLSNHTVLHFTFVQDPDQVGLLYYHRDGELILKYTVNANSITMRLILMKPNMICRYEMC